MQFLQDTNMVRILMYCLSVGCFCGLRVESVIIATLLLLAGYPIIFTFLYSFHVPKRMVAVADRFPLE
jgi:hypothetical protein